MTEAAYERRKAAARAYYWKHREEIRLKIKTKKATRTQTEILIDKALLREKRRIRYRTDPSYREYMKESGRNYYYRKKLERQKQNEEF